ncbi:hypothetical protein [Specibacter sp. NPDC078692]|uniref:hypothetical protein n=1 Tax=Specibacter sp. NPDC078692 TaxID=3155818 RepID=UPI00341D1419
MLEDHQTAVMEFTDGGVAMLMGATLQGNARWDGDVLYVDTAVENDGDNLGAIATCVWCGRIDPAAPVERAATRGLG